MHLISTNERGGTMQNMNNKQRYSILIIIFLIAVGTGTLWLWKGNDPYQKYKEVDDDNKLIGEVQSIVTESDEQKSFLHYPKFDQPDVDDYIEKWVQDLPKESDITYMDYESNEILDMYWNVTFHVQQLDADQNLIKTQDYNYTFHKDNGKRLSINDILRRDYGDMLKEQFQKQAEYNLTDIAKVHFTIGEDALVCYVEDKQITLPYDQFAKYMRIHGKGIAKTFTETKRTLSVDPNKKMIALTFDDGPSPYTEEFLKLFESYEANASFFMLGQNVINYPETVKHMAEGGFEICNHSWDHQSIASKDRSMIKREVFDTQDEIYRITGKEPTRIRPPYGAWNDLTQETMNDNGMKITLWNVDSEDWSNRDASVTLRRAKAGACDGAVILFHDLYPSTLEAVKQLIPYLQNEGYQLVTVSELFQYKGDLTGL